MLNRRFEEWEAEQLEDPEFRKIVEAMEPDHQADRLRIRKDNTQAELLEIKKSHGARQ